MTTLHAEMCARIAAAAGRPGGQETIAGLQVYMASAPAPPTPLLFCPSLYMVFQGAKRLLLSDREIAYRAGELVMAGVDVPALAQVTEASEGEPYLAVEIALDFRVLSALAAEMSALPRPQGEALVVRPLPDGVVEPTLRLLRLLDDPIDARILADGVKREILYRVLASPDGNILLQLAQADSVLARIGQATEWMHDHLGTPVTIDHLAGRARMGVTSFHRSFKSATGMTPGAYHKRLRLLEARRLVAMRADTLSQIATSVGYHSASHFSRDYKRAFGAAPVVDAKRFGQR
ncbi:transcriptional regulator, AraC family [Lentzea xinjiangensis]|uniref:Transcriptional regulator, AraC family n=1 Tax=Lentzea xinjiangensis TaxID=402600 RepID=A0A1H9UQU9_9PSEU|nr:AraC family transcriptional regulator [Lentzea xinjiangensis]SES11403.1 transcriptional regulator, AraC family [Lentzea xinjiangensis]